MKINKLCNKEIARAMGLFVVFQWGFAASLMAEDSCAKLVPVSKSLQSATSQPSADCNGYQQCIRQGQQLLQQGAADQAISPFKQALKDVGLDDVKRSNAYACIGVAYEAIPDKVMAEVYLEKASDASHHAISWIETEYKRLLSSQQIVMADDMERKLQAKREIQVMEDGQQPLEDTGTGNQPEALQTATADSFGNPPDGTNRTADGMTTVRGIKAGIVDYEKLPPKEKLQAKLDTTDHSPKPATTFKAQKRTKHHEYTPPSQVTNLSQQPSLDLRINFEYGSATLSPEGEKQADELGKALQKILLNTNQQATIVGHTDVFGGEEYNYHLSEDRAAAVKAYLSKNYPDIADKLSERGMGKRQPLYRETDDESQRLNRRVEVKLGRMAE
jgi:outer membrane protein OmpA-like peptidoglycan-associated protein